MERPLLDKHLSAAAFRSFYYLKEELVSFCKQEGLQATGSKETLTARIAHYLETGEKLRTTAVQKKKPTIQQLTLETHIEDHFVCSEVHRAFFKQEIGSSFSFNVAFQQWLKQNTGKTYQEAITAYHQLLAEKKKSKTTIDKQFEYNTYIRDFFEDNKDRSLKEAISCWKHKKSLAGPNNYERKDLQVL